MDDLNLDNNLDLNLDLDLDLDLGDLDLDLTKPVERDVGAFEAGVSSFGAGFAQFLAGDGQDKWYNQPIPELLGFVEEGTITPWSTSLQEFANKEFKNYQKYKPTVASYKDIETGGDLLSYTGENLAAGVPMLATLFTGAAAIPILAGQATGETYLQQEPEKKDFGRALLTGSIEGALNMPLTKTAKGIFKTLANTDLDETAKKSLANELIKGIATDAGVNSLQQIVRNYGVENEFSTTNWDEAAAAGIIVGAPLRGAQALSSKYAQAQMAEEASNIVAKTGDVAKADGIIDKFTNLTVGTALRPIRRIQATDTGQAIFKAIDDMRTDREVMAYSINDQLDNLMRRVKDEDGFFNAYAKGERNTPELLELEGIMKGIQDRANNPMGANLEIGDIPNYLPTFIDPKTFTPDMRKNLAIDYRNWFVQQPKEIRKELVTPAKARRVINTYAKRMEMAEKGTAMKMPRPQMDENGNITAASLVEVRSPIKSGQLEHTRQLGFIPQDILRNYSVNEKMTDQLKQYVFSAAQRITYAEQLGKNNQKVNGLLADANLKMKKGGEGLSRAEVDVLYDSLDAYQGIYKQFEGENIRKAATIFRSVTNAIALPLTLLSSLTEPFNLAIKVGNINAGKAFLQALQSVTQDLIGTITMGAVPKSEVNKQLAMTGRAFKDATTALNNRINGDQMGKYTQGFNNLFFHITGQTAMNYLVNSMAAHAAKSQAKNDIGIIASNPGTRAYNLALGRLNDLGISRDQAIALHRDSTLLNQMMPKIVAKFNRDVALNPESFDKPLWMSTGWGAMFGQLRGYPTMFSNTVLPKFLDMLDPRGKTKSEMAVGTAQFMTTVGSIVAIGFLQESLKNEMKGGTQTEEETLVKAIKNTVLPMQVGYLQDIATGNAARVVQPASFGIMDRQTGLLYKAANGEAKLEDLPFLSSFKGVL